MLIEHSDGKIGAVTEDVGPYIRFVEPNGSVRMVNRTEVSTKVRGGKAFYLHNGGEILYDYNKTPNDIEIHEDFILSDIHR